MPKILDDYLVGLEWRLPDELVFVAQLAYAGLLSLLCDYFADVDPADPAPVDLDQQLLKQGDGGPVKDAIAPGLDP